MKCHLCSNDLEPQFEDEEQAYQFDNNLWIAFFGGYGMFIESAGYVDSNEHPLKETGASYAVTLCHDCAHALCERESWMKELLQPARSHTHTQAYLSAHPDHPDPH